MKSSLIFISLFLSVPCIAQFQKVELPKWISIGRYKQGLVTECEMFYSVDDKNDTTYHWQYQNYEYSTISALEVIHFVNEGNTLNELYKILIESFSKDVDHETSFRLGKDIIIVIVKKTFGTKYLFISPPKGYFTMTKTGVNKLFNKMADGK